MEHAFGFTKRMEHAFGFTIRRSRLEVCKVKAMIPEVQIEFIQQFPMILTAFGSILTAVLVFFTNLRVEKNKASTDRTLKIADQKLDVIHDLTNSKLQQALDKIDLLENKIRQLIEEKNEIIRVKE